MLLLTGYHLIAYIKCLQDALGTDVVHFNTYIISILVIFYLQVNNNFPKLKDLSPSQIRSINIPPKIDGNALKQAVVDFFNFYGKKYEVSNDLISLKIGRFQKRKLDIQQKLNPEQKRFFEHMPYLLYCIPRLYLFRYKPILKHFSLRDGISANPGNWDNCTMFIEDISSPGVNVAAEIPQKEAHNFKKLCQVMTTFSHGNIIEEYISRLLPLQSTGKNDGSNLNVNSLTAMKIVSSISNETLTISLESLKTAIKVIEKEMKDSSPKPSISKQCENVINSMGANSTAVLSNITKLGDLIKTDKVSKAIAAEMINFVSRTETRIQNEAGILKLLATYLKGMDSKLKCMTFGSSTYGFGGSKTNLNILVNASKLKTFCRSIFE